MMDEPERDICVEGITPEPEEENEVTDEELDDDYS